LVDKHDCYIPLLPAIRFAELAQRSQGIVDFGFQAANQLHFGHLSEKLRSLVSHAPTLFVALQRACKWASHEDTILSMWLERFDDHLRVCTKLDGTRDQAYLEHSQWLQLIFSIHIVRQFVGSQWNPATIAFEAHYTPSAETRAFWPQSRFLSGQHASWIDVPIALLSIPSQPNAIAPVLPGGDDAPSDYEIVGLLKMMLPSYLDEGAPALVEAAEMAGLSTRSFQRKLANAGFSYSALIDAARFEHATKLLRDSDSRIIEIAFSSGYSDHAHFTRAFRRMAGVSPRQFREQSRREPNAPS